MYARACLEEQKDHGGGAGVANLALAHLTPAPQASIQLETHFVSRKSKGKELGRPPSFFIATP